MDIQGISIKNNSLVKFQYFKNVNFRFDSNFQTDDICVNVFCDIAGVCVCVIVVVDSELKACLIASVVFILQMRGIFFVSAPFSLVYFGVVLFLIYFDVVTEVLNVHDPFSVFENVVCSVLFTSWRRAASTNVDDSAATTHQKSD